MGRAKEEQIEAEDNWMSKARSEGIRCAVCGSTINYGDRETFYETQKCGPCENVWSKDD